MKHKNLFLFGALVSTFMPLMASCSAKEGTGGDLDKIIESKTLVIGTNSEYAPFEYINAKTGKIAGYDIMVADLIKDHLDAKYDTNIKIEFADMQFDSLIMAMNTNSIDMILAAFTVDEERQKTLLFSDIYYQSETVVVTKKTNTTITDYASLNKKKLGCQLGTMQVDEAIKAAGDEKYVTNIASTATLLLQLLSDSIDALVIEKPVAESFIRANSDLQIVDAITFEQSGGYAIASNKSSTKLISELNEMIHYNKANGTLDKIFVDAVKEHEDQASASNDGYHFDFGVIKSFLPTFGKGVLVTIGLSAATILIGTLLGFLLSLARISKFKVLSYPARFYIALIRGTPLLIQLYLFAYGIPMLLPQLHMSVTFAGILALGLNSTAYVAEIFRAGIQSVDIGQMEAAKSYGLSKAFTIKEIIFPQALRNILPSIGNEFVTMVKESSIVSVVGIVDITRAADLGKASTAKVIEFILFAALLYFAITTILTYAIKFIEKKVNKYVTR